MPDYLIFGGCLRSEIPLPELVEAPGGVPDWTFRLGALPDVPVHVLAHDQLSSTCVVRLALHGDRLRYEHSCTGVFEISADRRSIVLHPWPAGDLNVARTDLIARVLLFCVDHANVTWLHGSAVRCGDDAIGFVGVSGAGKSTTALLLARAGARHVCDDTIPIEHGAPPTVRPSDHTIRLCDDTKHRIAARDTAVRREADGKHILRRDALEQVGASIETRVPLRALYVMAAAGIAPDIPGTPLVRHRLSGIAAVRAVMPHVKSAPLVDAADAARTLRHLASIVAGVAVYSLHVTRDWNTVDRVVEQLLRWHPLHEPLPLVG